MKHTPPCFAQPTTLNTVNEIYVILGEDLVLEI